MTNLNLFGAGAAAVVVAVAAAAAVIVAVESMTDFFLRQFFLSSLHRNQWEQVYDKTRFPVDVQVTLPSVSYFGTRLKST